MASFAERMMAKMGYVQGHGLGPDGAGITIPIRAVGTKGKSGLGYVPPPSKRVQKRNAMHGALAQQQPAISDFEARIIEDAIERSDGQFARFPESFQSFAKAEKYVEGVLEWKGFRYGVAPQASRCFTVNMMKRVHYEIARLAYNAGAFTLPTQNIPKAPARAKSQVPASVPKQGKMRKTRIHAIEADVLRLESLIPSWPPSFDKLLNANDYANKMCIDHNFIFSYFPGSNPKSFRKTVRQTVALRAHAAGIFSIKHPGMLPSLTTTLPPLPRVTVEVPPATDRKIAPLRTTSRASPAASALKQILPSRRTISSVVSRTKENIIPPAELHITAPLSEQASVFPNSTFSFRCDPKEVELLSTALAHHDPASAINNIQHLVTSFRGCQGVSNVANSSLSVPGLVNEVSMILGHARFPSSTATFLKNEEEESSIPADELQHHNPDDESSSNSESVPRSSVAPSSLHISYVEDMSPETELDLPAPKKESTPILEEESPSPRTPSPTRSGEQEVIVLESELDVRDPVDLVCSMLGERIAAAEDRSRQLRADQTCRDLGKLIAEAERRLA